MAVRKITAEICGFWSQYEYNAAGLRTNKVANGQTQLYYYPGEKLSHITGGSNSLKFFFTRDANGNLVNMIDYSGGTPHYLLVSP